MWLSLCIWKTFSFLHLKIRWKEKTCTVSEKWLHLSQCVVLPTNIFFFRRNVWSALGVNVWCLSGSSVFPCHRGSENNPILSSKWPGKPHGRSLSIAGYKQADSLSAGKAVVTEWPHILSGLCLSHVCSLCLEMRFYPSAHLHLSVLSFQANCYSVFHFCDMSMPYLSPFELAVATHY